MDKENTAWDLAKLEEWKKFWESEMGCEALKKMRAIKEQCLNDSMTQSDPHLISAYVGRAAGVELILQDIQAGLTALSQRKEASKPRQD